MAVNPHLPHSLDQLMPLYVGFDSSTQSLTAAVIEPSPMPVRPACAVFAARGRLRRGASRVTARPAGWTPRPTAGRDLVAGDVGRGAGDDDGAAARRRRRVADRPRSPAPGNSMGASISPRMPDGSSPALDPKKPLASQLDGAFSRPDSPVWLDCSTTRECATLNDAAVGGPGLAVLTGSRAYERFTAAQIRKFATADPEAYARTARIHLVSSYMASLLCGADAPLEPGDASGMNLMDIATRQWAPRRLAATAPDLARTAPADPRVVDGRRAPCRATGATLRLRRPRRSSRGPATIRAR